ncbi:MAG: cysteine--tRNA ligase [Pseudomonadota bacterium]
MTLQIYDTMKRKKRPFEPADRNRVTMYVCGPTVYDHAHIGNFRSVVAFDLLFRVLRHLFGQEAVVYSRNVTDIDDKIIAAANAAGVSTADISTKFAQIYRDETSALNVLKPTFEPAATGHIDEMFGLVGTLLERGFAYVAKDHVLFSVKRYKDYGALSGVNQDEMLAGARVEVAPFKDDPRDFVLWKPSADDEPGWEPPAEWGLKGKGRPGWHLECSAMIEKTLGDTIDIHGGGQDLRFPHHENEIAQSVCSTGADLARYWVHNGFLRMGSDKMSKSIGNVVLPRDLLKQWNGETLRWALLSAHYRQPLEWTNDLVAQSKRQLDKFYRIIGDFPDIAPSEPSASVMDALTDDLNSPAAFAALHELREGIAKASGAAQAERVSSLKASGRLLGFFEATPEEWFKGVTPDAASMSDGEISQLLEERAAARRSKNYSRADEIRDLLAADGITIEDGPSGATWRRG